MKKKVATYNRKFRSFEKARKYVHTLGLKNVEEWKKFKNSNKLPEDIPRGPQGVYENKGWTNWGDFLGTGYTYKKKFRTYEEAQKFCKENNINGQRDWESLSKSGKRPNDLPSSPSYTYKKEWKSWGDFTGSGRIQNQMKSFRSFEDARKFVHKLNLKSSDEWRSYIKSGKKPNDIPNEPGHVYKDKGWKGMGDWLGTGNLHPSKMNFPPIIEAKILARKVAKELGIDSIEKWNAAFEAGKIPKNLPRDLNSKYGQTDSIDDRRRKWREQARRRKEKKK